MIVGTIPDPGHAMANGDPRRPLIGRAAFWTLLAATTFFVFTMTKQIGPIYSHAPWVDDPFDTVLSFTMFFVPLMSAYLSVQVLLCRKPEPLPIERVVTILRACSVTVGLIVAELLTAWVAVGVGANRSEWTGPATSFLVALLILSTVVTGKVLIDIARALRLLGLGRTENVQESDWLADVVAVAQKGVRWLGPLCRPGNSALDWIDGTLVGKVRRHPLVAAVVASGVFAMTVFGWQAIREGYAPPVSLLAMGLGFCGMFAFLVLSGSYLGVVRSPIRLYGLRRRVVDASVISCIAAVGALAFRDFLLRIVGSDSSATAPGQFGPLAGCVSLIAFVVVVTGETLLRSHARPLRDCPD